MEHVYSKPAGASSLAIWSEQSPVLKAVGWSVSGFNFARTVFPDGIAIYTPSDKARQFTCSYRYFEMLLSLKMTTHIVTNQTSPGLVDCKNECFEFVIGDITMGRQH